MNKVLLSLVLLLSLSSAYGGDCFKDGDVNDCRASSLRDSNALNELGAIYYKGRGVAQDYGKAIKSWKRAAQQGNVASQLNLGHMYEDGKGVAQNYPEALGWFKKAAEQGNAFAEEQVKVVEEKIAKTEEQGNAFAEEQVKVVEEKIAKTEEEGSAVAQFNYGNAYFWGNGGVVRDRKEALKWYVKSAEQGHAGAMLTIYTLSLEMPFDVDTNYALGNIEDKKGNVGAAVRWYRKAAKQGHSDAQFRVGFWEEKIEERNVIASQPLVGVAFKWYTLAAKQGHSRAIKRIGILKDKYDQRTDASAARESEQTFQHDLESGIALAVVISFIGMLVVGMNNKIVIYFDKRDFYISLMPWVSLFIGLFIASWFETPFIQNSFLVISFIAAVLFSVWAVKLSVIYNQSTLLGVFVGIFKVLCSLLGIVLLIGTLQKMFSKDSGLKDFIVGTILLGVFIWIGKKLINGEQVYRSKGWDFPETEDA